MDILLRRRDVSPIFSTKEVKSRADPKKKVLEEKELLQNGFFWEEVDGRKERRCKINRMPMLSTAEVEIAAVHSPSLIFIRIVNNIRDQLVVREPSVVVSLEESELHEFNYVLCPVEDRAYGRARILKIEPNPDDAKTKLVQLILIDDGTIVWAKSSSLVSLDPERCAAAKDLAYHPWQIQAVSLAGVYPKRTPRNPACKWNKNVRRQLQRIVDRFNKFTVKAVTMSVTNNDYNIPTAVRLIGIPSEQYVNGDEDDEQGEEETGDNYEQNETEKEKMRREICEIPLQGEFDIGSTLAGALPHEMDSTELHDGMMHERFETRYSAQEEKQMESRFIEDIRMRCFPVWKREEAEEERKEPHDWVQPLNSVVIEDMTLEWLESQNYVHQSRVFVTIEGDYTVSPWELYGRPIKMIVETTGKAGVSGDQMLNDAEAIIKGNNILKNHAAELDAFYSKSCNRKPIKKNEIFRVLTAGKRPYAICQAGGDRAEYTGVWQRVEVLKDMKDCASIRFIDSGGTDLVQYEALFNIHPDHTTWPALCVQLCVYGLRLKTLGAETWAEGEMTVEKHKSVEAFRSRLRTDLPLSFTVLPESEIPSANFGKKQGISYERRGVLYVTDLKIQGVPEKESYILPKMLADGLVREDSNAPFQRKLQPR